MHDQQNWELGNRNWEIFSLWSCCAFFIGTPCVCLMKLYILGCQSQQVLLEQSSNFMLIHEFENA